MRIEKIKTIYDELNSIRLDDFVFYKFERKVNLILDEIKELINEEENIELKARYLENLHALYHTLGKEVSYIEHHEKEMRKKNAAKKREIEYRQARDKAFSN